MGSNNSADEKKTSTEKDDKKTSTEKDEKKTATEKKTSTDKKTPALTFKCKKTGEELEVTILSCKNLPDLDGAWNLTDAYVIVKVGTKKQRTKAVGGELNPTFEKDNTLKFTIKDAALQSRIRFQVMDKDTFSADDLIGKASMKLSKVEKVEKEFTLELVGHSDGETHLSDAQTSAIYNLFTVLDPDNTGAVKHDYMRLKAAPKAGKAAVLLDELKSYLDEKKDLDGDKAKVSFGELLEQFRNNEDPGNAKHIDELTAEVKIIIAG